MRTHKSVFLLGIIIAIALSASAAYSLFSKTITIDTNFVFGNADIELESLFDTQDFTFEDAGDSKEVSLNVENQGENALEYYFGIEIEEAGGLENMIMVYFDNNFVGMLCDLCDSEEYIMETSDYLYLNEQREHTLTLELHMGAESYHENKALKLKINAYGKTINNQEVIFVSDEYEMTQAITTLSAGAKIKLAQDITLTTPLQIDKDIIIDLYGKNLILDNVDLIISNGRTSLENSREIPQTINTGSGNISIDGNNALFYMEEGTGHYIDTVNLLSFDMQTTLEEIVQRISQRIGRGLYNGSYDVFKNDVIYYDLFTQIDDEYADFDNGVLTVYPTTSSKISKLSFFTEDDLYEIEYKIYAMGTAATAEDIAQNQLAYLYNLQDPVFNDIFLPTRLKAYNTHIEWHSSQPNIISIDGKYTPAIEDTQVTLIAFINVEGDIYPYSFHLDVLGQSNEARFRYFLTRYGDLLFTSLGQINYLPLADSQSQYYYSNYTDGRDLKITDLTYDLDLQYDFLTLNTNELTLSSITYVQYAQLNVNAEF
ncbi:MAG: immunoglobulin-like domain-containing protein, partial [Bacillota bacterium]